MEPENHCLVCGRKIGWPWDAFSSMRCDGCGADNWQQRPPRVATTDDLVRELDKRDRRRAYVERQHRAIRGTR